jgi:hypothetical protein
MKPIKAADAAQAAAPAALPSIADAVKAIDVSSLDRLIAIRQETAKLAEYRAKADEKKADVSEAVYARVSQDYTKRAAALDSQSAPLRAQARTEWRKLKTLLDALGARQDQAQLEKDELQFRHTVGELTDGELAAKLVDPQHVLDECARDRRELDASKARFVEALGSEEALEASEPTPPIEAAAAPAAATPQNSPAAASGQTAATPKPPDEDPGETRVARPLPDLDQATRLVTAGAPPVARPAPPSPSAKAAAEDVADSTVMLATAALVVDGAGGKEYPLTVMNGIGRAEENRICLASPGISRKHAVVNAAAGGFTIKDLGSQNGTYVNGQRVAEKRLVEGDTVEVGSVKFVFRSPWPPRGGAAATRGEAATQGKD